MRSVILGSFVGFLLAAGVLAACGGAGDSTQLAAMAARMRALEETVQIMEEELSAQDGRLDAMSASMDDMGYVLEPISRSPEGHDIYFTDVNVHVRSGTGQTSNINGRGNVIIGYDEHSTEDDATWNKTGSHNLVVGMWHGYTAHSGIVSGARNRVNEWGASVLGGYGNRAHDFYAVVCGGQEGTASGNSAAVLGGNSNTASGDQSTVSGGQANQAQSWCASNGGGRFRVASGDYDWVAGSLFEPE